MSSTHVIFIICMLIGIRKGVFAATFTLVNKCEYTVWPGILANAGSQKLDSTGFELGSGGSRVIQAPPKWSGRVWGRTRCRFDPNTGEGNCTTANCGPTIECNGAGAIPPATLAEFTIGISGGQDFYDVSLVDGYNVGIKVEPIGGSGKCGSTGCSMDPTRICPVELRVGDGLGCQSACGAFGKAEFCCSGAFASPSTCKPSVYSRMFKAACPTSYTYAYDDATSTFTCTAANYLLTFCPSVTNSYKPLPPPPLLVTGTSNAQPPAATIGTLNGTSNGQPIAAGGLNGQPVATTTLNAPPPASNESPAVNGTSTEFPGPDPDTMPRGNQYDWPWLPIDLTGDSSMQLKSPISSAIASVILSLIFFTNYCHQY